MKILGDAGNYKTRDIIVKGCQVDKVRKGFGIGGSKFSETGARMLEDNTPPHIEIGSVRKTAEKWTVGLSSEPETIKVEVYVDGKLLLPVFKNQFKSLEISMEGIGNGSHTAAICAYDRFLNCERSELELIK